MTKKSTFLTFILSWLPGVGHLYLGLNRRGLQFMASFFVCIILIPLLPFVFPFALAMIWFYALFDALQKAALINSLADRSAKSPLAGDEMGTPISSATDLDEALLPLEVLNHQTSAGPLWVGGLFVVVGCLVLVREVFPEVWDILVHLHVASILLAVALIGFGVWLIRKYVKKV